MSGERRNQLHAIAMLAAGCDPTPQTEDGDTDAGSEVEAEDHDVQELRDDQEPGPATCDDTPLTVEQLDERFDALLGTPVCIEGRIEAAGCTCIEDWPCTPPDCGYICSGRPGLKAESTYFFVEDGWECACTYGGGCISCTPFDCGEVVRIIVVPEIYLDVMKRLVIEEVCFPPLPEP